MKKIFCNTCLRRYCKKDSPFLIMCIECAKYSCADCTVHIYCRPCFEIEKDLLQQIKVGKIYDEIIKEKTT